MIWLQLAFLWVSTVLASPSDDVNHHVIQAEHFLKRGWVADAEAEYQAAYSLPEGPKSTDLASVGARIAWARLDVESAMLRSQQLASLSSDPNTARAARIRAESYANDFGFVEIHGAHPGTRAPLSLQANQPILDPRLADYSRQIQEKHRTPTMLPIRFALPVGPWEINGQPVLISADQESLIELSSQGSKQRLSAALQASRVEISSGFLFWLGPSKESSVPGPAVDLRWIMPLQEMDLEATVNWNSAWSLHSSGHVQRQNFDMGGAVAMGRDISTPSALFIRPVLGVQLQSISNLDLICNQSLECWSCTQATGEPSDSTPVSAQGWALMPLAALSLDYRAPPGLPAMASGFRLSFFHAIGKTTESGTTALPPGPTTSSVPTHWQVDNSIFHSWQFRLQASIALAF